MKTKLLVTNLFFIIFTMGIFQMFADRNATKTVKTGAPKGSKMHRHTAEEHAYMLLKGLEEYLASGSLKIAVKTVDRDSKKGKGFVKNYMSRVGISIYKAKLRNLILLINPSEEIL